AELIHAMAVPPVSLVRAVDVCPYQCTIVHCSACASASSSSSRHVRTISFSCWHGCQDDGATIVACNVVYLRQPREFARAGAQSIGDDPHARHHSDALITIFGRSSAQRSRLSVNSSAATPPPRARRT